MVAPAAQIALSRCKHGTYATFAALSGVSKRYEACKSYTTRRNSLHTPVQPTPGCPLPSKARRPYAATRIVDMVVGDVGEDDHGRFWGLRAVVLARRTAVPAAATKCGAFGVMHWSLARPMSFNVTLCHVSPPSAPSRLPPDATPRARRSPSPTAPMSLPCHVTGGRSRCGDAW